MQENFEHDFMAELGFDANDPQVAAALEDAETHMRLVETLVGVRKQRDMKQRVVAERMETTQSRVSNFERIGGDPRLSTILRYARAVDAKVRMTVSVTPRGWTTANTTLKAPVTSSSTDVHLGGAWQSAKAPAGRVCA
jgi:transcriptional regulator with XRE-family HTH domain